MTSDSNFVLFFNAHIQHWGEISSRGSGDGHREGEVEMKGSTFCIGGRQERGKVGELSQKRDCKRKENG